MFRDVLLRKINLINRTMNIPQPQRKPISLLLALLFLFAFMQMGYGQLCSVDAGPDQTLTQVSPVFLNASSPIVGTGTWTQLSGPTLVSFTDPADPGTEVTNTAPGTYIFEWTVSDATCDTNSDTAGVSIVGVDLEMESLTSNTSPDLGEVVAGNGFHVCAGSILILK